MSVFRLAIVGSRKFTNYALMKEILDPHLIQIGEIVSGGAYGADTLAQRYAQENGIPIMIYYPNYRRHAKKKAPILRNLRIARYCDRMVAFAYSDSKGTRHVIREAQRLKKGVLVIELKEADR